MIMRSLLCFLVLVSTVTADCSSSTCSENGSCINGECQCEPNYTGANCSIPFETCEDGELTCLYGSTCSSVVRNNNNNNDVESNTYYCDCTDVYGSSPFAGLQCDQVATSYCVEGGSSKYAFCTNGGICERIVPGGSPHPGCKCSEEFEGMQCQYVKGQAPAEDLGQPYQMVMPQGGSSGDEEGVAIFLLVIICIGVIVGLGYVLYRRRKSRRKETTTTSTGVTTASADEPDAEII